MPATKEMLETLVDGLPLPSDSVTPIFVIDMMGNRLASISHCVTSESLCFRYNEWGRACWVLQKELLQGRGNIDWHFSMFVSQDDLGSCNVADVEKWMQGHIMQAGFLVLAISVLVLH